MSYDYFIEYKQGKFNQVVDGLSRKGETTIICILTPPSPNWWDSVVELHDTNIEIKNLKVKSEKGELGEHWSIKKGVFFYKNRIYLTEDSDFVQLFCNNTMTLSMNVFTRLCCASRNASIGET